MTFDVCVVAFDVCVLTTRGGYAKHTETLTTNTTTAAQQLYTSIGCWSNRHHYSSHKTPRHADTNPTAAAQTPTAVRFRSNRFFFASSGLSITQSGGNQWSACTVCTRKGADVGQQLDSTTQFRSAEKVTRGGQGHLRLSHGPRGLPELRCCVNKLLFNLNEFEPANIDSGESSPTTLFFYIIFFSEGKGP